MRAPGPRPRYLGHWRAARLRRNWFGLLKLGTVGAATDLPPSGRANVVLRQNLREWHERLQQGRDRDIQGHRPSWEGGVPGGAACRAYKA
jgi:hypothetical protein